MSWFEAFEVSFCLTMAMQCALMFISNLPVRIPDGVKGILLWFVLLLLAAGMFHGLR